MRATRSTWFGAVVAKREADGGRRDVARGESDYESLITVAVTTSGRNVSVGCTVYAAGKPRLVDLKRHPGRSRIGRSMI